MKRALIICYYWPPAGGPGVQRWLKFVKYLRDFDIEPVVYVPQNAQYPIRDASLEKEVPKGISILKKRIFEPYTLAGLFSKKHTKQLSSGIIQPQKKQSLLQKLMLYIRGNLFIPDARKWWVNPSARYLYKYLRKHPVDCIITTGPPHSLHLIGLRLKQKMGVSWLADFRDPWTHIGYHKKLKINRYSQKKHEKLEAEVLGAADHLVVTSPATKALFEGMTLNPVTCITNGFDDENQVKADVDSHFSIAHIGSLLEERNPKILWEVLGELNAELPDFSESLKIILAGRVSPSIVEDIQAYGLSKHLELPGYVTHSKALQLQHSSQVLLLIEIDSPETQLIIPGKLFEYLAASRPIIAIGPKNSDIEGVLKESKAGKYFKYEDKQALKEELAALFRAFKTTGIKQPKTDLKPFTRRHLTGQLARCIHNL